MYKDMVLYIDTDKHEAILWYLFCRKRCFVSVISLSKHCQWTSMLHYLHLKCSETGFFSETTKELGNCTMMKLEFFLSLQTKVVILSAPGFATNLFPFVTIIARRFLHQFLASSYRNLYSWVTSNTLYKIWMEKWNSTFPEGIISLPWLCMLHSL